MPFEFPDEVAQAECIARFILDRKHYSSERCRVKYNAFIPPKDDPSVSCYRSCQLAVRELCEIGVELVARPRQKGLFGWSSLSAECFTEQGLAFEITEKPHPRHVNVRGWPVDTEKARLIALQLANDPRNRTAMFPESIAS